MTAKEKKSVYTNKEEARRRVLKIFPILVRTYPDAKVTLHYKTPFELLIATILAAQCTDERVNQVTAKLFQKYRGPEDYLKVPIEELKEDIRSTGFYNNKAEAIRSACQSILEKFNGRIPDTMEELLQLKGVGRKTANVILGNCFGKPAIICDTHMLRLSRRLGLSSQTDPVKLEFDLMEIVPKDQYGGWTKFSHCIVAHGRACCTARKPDCAHCPIARYCPSAGNPD